MFKNADLKFDAIAVDAVQRRQRIEELRKARNVTFWVALLLLIFVCLFIVAGIVMHQPELPIMPLLILIVLINWTTFLRLDSDFKLMRVIDLLHGPRP